MRIHDLGRIEVESSAGSPAALIVGAKQIALLSVLCALRAERVSLDVLREAGWGEQQIVADATIENHVWRLRKALEPGTPAAQSCVTHDWAGYRLDLPPDAVDSAVFESLAGDARDAAQRAEYRTTLELCERALALWRGDLYRASAHVPAVEAAIDRLVEIRAQLEERRVDALLALGETERAALEGGRLTALHPFREHLWAQRMTALARLGRPEEALSVFRQVRSVLLDELGLDPGRELRELQRAIIAQEEAGAIPAGPIPPVALKGSAASARPPWPLIGRLAETAVITAALEVGCSVVIDGASGVGRTRMLDEAARIALDAGAEVFRFVGTRSAASVPLGALADLVPLAARADDPLILLQRCGEALRARAAGGRLLICVDDAHLLDDPSAALILHLASAGDVAVALTQRTR